MVDPALAETAAGGKARVPGADDEAGDAFDGWDLRRRTFRPLEP